MTRQQSFTKIENELLPRFRKQVGEAESTGEVQKFFRHCIRELFAQASDGRVSPADEDIDLLTEGQETFRIGERVRCTAGFAEIWEGSDLAQIVSRFAEAARNRFRHLAKNPEKTEAKIRM
jgi:hypothetical protein